MPSKKCEYEGCTKWASFNLPGLKRPLYCRPHSTEGMVNVVSRQRCTYADCPKQANFNHPGETRGLYCKEHIENGMVDVRHKHCMHPGCPKQATCNIPGSGGGMFCGQHKLEGMVNVVLKRCAHDGCETFPSFGLPGQPGVQFCRLHKTPGMARRTNNTASRSGAVEQMGMDTERCAHPGCCQARPMFCITHIHHQHDPMGQQMADMHSQEDHMHSFADMHSMQLQQQSEAEQQHMAHQLPMDSQSQLQHHLHNQLQDPGIPPGFSAADIAAWQQGLSGMSGDQHVTYEHQTAVGAPVEQDPSQVHFHHETVTGHPEAYGHKVEDSNRIDPVHDP